ncbi:hypothetical protein HPP92_007330 [Vanilla planifolia]|uniref:Pentatricopeptide repeat-containing protein n=1 Tax=Vanilla planifolia TaxID=51239 RepID=A0A835V8T3_VANPL|nr:hypothetical protein HPP92_007534 [Vanilla planifolia]KAG0490467.1 hypothetical protein HPP92_007330 [Vanilla planifolia]
MLPALGLRWTKSAILSSRLFHAADHFNVSAFTLPSLLKNCARNLDIEQGKRLHAAIIHLTLHSDPFIASSLIMLYSKCGKLLYADHVFGQLPHRDTSVWNSIIWGYFLHHRSKDGLSLLRHMQLAGFRPDGHSVTILLGGCSDGQLDVEHGKQVHGYLIRTALEDDNFTLTALIHMYSRTNETTRARKVFDGISDKSASMWNAIISGYCYNGLWEKSLEIFVLLTGEDCEVHSETVSAVLAACVNGGATEFARAVHCCAIKMALELNSFVCTSLVTIYSSAGDMDAAFRIFQAANNKEVQLWNSMLSAFVSSSFFLETLGYYNRMRSVGINPDSITITIVLSACNAIGQWEFGWKIHGLLIKRPEFNTSGIQSSLISMYMKNGDVKCATILFCSIKEPDVVILSSMITGFFQNRKYDHALQKFNEFRSEGFILDSGVVATIVSTCTAIDLLHLGCQIHSFAIKNGTSSDAYVGSSLINMYSKCGLLLSAESVFFTTTEKNVVVWNSLISAYSRSCLLSKAIITFAGIAQSGLFPDSVSLTSVLVSVSACAALSYGKMIHGYQVRNGISCDELVENSLIDMYMKCGCLRNAQLLFRRMAVRNTVTWNTMIAGYGFLGHCLKAIDLFDEMQKLRISPDGTTFSL